MRSNTFISQDMINMVRSLANIKYERQINSDWDSGVAVIEITSAYRAEKDNLISCVRSLDKQLQKLLVELESDEIKSIDRRRISNRMMDIIEKIGSFNQILTLSEVINDEELCDSVNEENQ